MACLFWSLLEQISQELSYVKGSVRCGWELGGLLREGQLGVLTLPSPESVSSSSPRASSSRRVSSASSLFCGDVHCTEKLSSINTRLSCTASTLASNLAVGLVLGWRPADIATAG
jgi:hypothetical protein